MKYCQSPPASLLSSSLLLRLYDTKSRKNSLLTIFAIALLFCTVTSFSTSSSHQSNNKRSSLNMNVATSVGRRLVGKLKPETTAFLLCDIQERFRPLVYHSETIVNTSRYMTSVAKALNIPILITQQYTKVFGPTVTECFADPKDLESTPIFEKKKFSMCTEEVCSHMGDNLGHVQSIVLFGIEAHVCLQQTALDLLEQGKDVHIIVDGVSSQQPFDREVALTRMSQAGAFLTTAQSAAFMLMQSADHENFKAVSKLTVAHMKELNEFNDKLLGKKQE